MLTYVMKYMGASLDVLLVAENMLLDRKDITDEELRELTYVHAQITYFEETGRLMQFRVH